MLNEKIVKKNYSPEFAAHSWDHIQRVHSFAMRIAKNEKKVNLKILDAAVWFHDIARPLEFHKKCECHAKTGAEIVVPILKKLKFNEEEIKIIANAISVHRFSRGEKAESIEAKILQDADRLDALGAITVARIFTYGGAKGRSIEGSVKRFYEKQLKLKPHTFNTKTAQHIAKERYAFVKLFLSEINKDLKLEK